MRHSRGSRRRVAGGDAQRGLAAADPKRTARDECPLAGTPLGRPVRRRPDRCLLVARSLSGSTARGSRLLLFLNIKKQQDGSPALRWLPLIGCGMAKLRPQPLSCGRGSPVFLVSPVTSAYAAAMPAAAASRTGASNGFACSRGIDVGRSRAVSAGPAQGNQAPLMSGGASPRRAAPRDLVQDTASRCEPAALLSNSGGGDDGGGDGGDDDDGNSRQVDNAETDQPPAAYPACSCRAHAAVLQHW